MAAGRRTHSLQPGEQEAQRVFTGCLAGACRVGNLLLARMGALGNRFAGAVAAVPPSAGIRPLGTTQRVTKIIDDRSGRDFRSMLHALACEQPLGSARNLHFLDQPGGKDMMRE